MCDTKMQSESIDQVVTALAKAQGSVLKAKEDSKNPFFKSKYADLAAVWDACRDALSKNGLAVIQTIQKDEDRMLLITTLAHTGGQWIRSLAPIPYIKPDPQSVGSAITYMRRYSLAAIVGISTADDDGEAATGAYRRENPNGSPANGSRIKTLIKLLDKDEDLKKRIMDYIAQEGLKKIEDLPPKVIEVTIKSALKRTGDKVIEYPKGNAQNE